MSTMNELQQRINAHFEMSKQLEGLYNEVWGDMVVYLRTSTLTDEQAEDLVEDITTILLEAQSRGATPASAFGNDYQKFCDDMIQEASVNVPVKAKAENTLRLILSSFNLSLFFAWLNTLKSTSKMTMDALTTVNISVALLLIMVIIMVTAVSVLKWFHTKVYDKKYDYMPAWRKALPAILVCVVVTGLTIAIRQTLNNIVLARVHIAWPIFLMIGVWVYGKYIAGRQTGKVEA